MVDRLERERRRGGEMVEREGVGAEGGAEGGGRGNWREGRRSSRADTPRPDDDDDDDGRARGVREGVVRSGSGKSRKEVRWSKDVDYEG